MTESPSNKSTAFEHAKRDLIAAIEQLRTEEGWQRWLTAKAHMPRYSWMNQIRVWVQDPEATLVRGKRQWREDFNRSLENWEPIWILAPMTKKLEEDGETKRKVFFRAVKVFDVRHTAPLPNEPEIPLAPPSEPIDGETHEWAVHGLTTHAEELGYSVSYEVLDGAKRGYCDHSAKQIVVEECQPINAMVRVLVHELAHAHGITYEEGRRHAEACADAAAFLTCSAIGLDVSGESVPYIAGWHDAAEEVIESDLKRLQAIVDTLAKAAESTLNDETPAEDQSTTEVPSEASERLTGAHHPVEA